MIAATTDRGACSVIEIASGHGRNTRALIAAGLEVTPVTDEAAHAPLPFPDGAFDAAISTHGIFHGQPRDASALCAEIARVLRREAAFYLTLASTRDARFGQGRPLGANTFAPLVGPEAGVPHIFFDEASARELLEPAFRIEELREVDVAGIAGGWAHADTGGMRHLFITATSRAAR